MLHDKTPRKDGAKVKIKCLRFSVNCNFYFEKLKTSVKRKKKKLSIAVALNSSLTVFYLL